MCAIAGILSLHDDAPVPPEELKAMTDAMVLRGPDDEGFYFGEGVGLGMRRLSIIDLGTGRQPIPNEDRTVWVVLNGEIYNYQELRDRLVARGHVFRTQSDTEVIVHLYEEEGSACVSSLRGMFAFAVWDRRRRQLLLARDRVGIKPLYHATRDGRFYFASELKALLAVLPGSARLDWAAVEHLFAFGTTPREQSIVAGVEKLPPAHLLVASRHAAPITRRYWEVRFEPDRRRSEGEWVEALRHELSESVRLHMLADVPLGAFLSGGVDSSAVVAAMIRERPSSVQTFSIGFRESGFDELPYARLVSQALGTEHHEVVLDPSATEVLDELAFHLDEPFGDSSAIPTYFVSKLAASAVKVVLSGDGGDELFAGYDRYAIEERERRRPIPAALRRLMGNLGDCLPEGAKGREFLRHQRLTGGARYIDAGTLFKREQRARLFQPEALLMLRSNPGAFARGLLDDDRGHWLSALQRLDIETYLPLDILTKVDRMSMAHSIEARVPLLDHKLIELAARIPPELQLRNGHGKQLFKKALEGWLPQEVLHRPKKGFAIPLGHWFRGQLGDVVRDLLTSKTARERGIVQGAYVEELLRLHAAGRPLDLQLFTLISFELWCRRFLDGGGARPRLETPPPAFARAAGMATAGMAGAGMAGARAPAAAGVDGAFHE